MRLLSTCFLYLVLLQFTNAQSDTVFNQSDANNYKQGYWKKFFPNGKLMYKGFFKDNKPVGEMRRYFESGAIKAVLNYDPQGEYAHAQLFYENGSPAADGKFYHSLKDSIWTYYSFYNKTVTSRESYVKGKRHGMMLNYFNNGDVSEKLEWKNDQKSGLWEQYYQGSILKLKANYTDHKLDGDFVVYTADGNLYNTGKYRNDQREDKWTFYNADGTVQIELNYQSGKVAEKEQLDKEQQEFFRSIDEAQGKFNEPDETDFLSPQAK